MRRGVQPQSAAPQVERPPADGKNMPVEQRRRAEVSAQLEAAVRPSMAVRIEQRDGLPVTSVLDPETGQTLLQLPPEQVVRAVEASLARTRLGLGQGELRS
jgi:hypothetical protein